MAFLVVHGVQVTRLSMHVGCEVPTLAVQPSLGVSRLCGISHSGDAWALPLCQRLDGEGEMDITENKEWCAKTQNAQLSRELFNGLLRLELCGANPPELGCGTWEVALRGRGCLGVRLGWVMGRVV